MIEPLKNPPTEGAFSLSQFIVGCIKRDLLNDGDTVDTGGGFGARDIWVTVDGKEFFISVREKVPA